MKITSSMKTNEDELNYYNYYLNFFEDLLPWQPHNKWCETGYRIPHDEYNVRGIPHVRAYIKDDIFMTEQYKVFE